MRHWRRPRPARAGRVPSRSSVSGSLGGASVVASTSRAGDATVSYHAKIHAVDPEHATGSGQGTATSGGKTLNSTVQLDMKWLGPTCPKDDAGN